MAKTLDAKYKMLRKSLKTTKGVIYMYNRPFHYPEDHGGVKPKRLSPFVGPKSKISKKLDQN